MCNVEVCTVHYMEMRKTKFLSKYLPFKTNIIDDLSSHQNNAPAESRQCIRPFAFSENSYATAAYAHCVDYERLKVKSNTV